MAASHDNNNMIGENNNDTDKSRVEPLFIKNSDISDNGEFFTEYLMCKAIGNIIGDKNIEGCQRVRGLWRIYLTSQTQRAVLGARGGVAIRGTRVPIFMFNPFATNYHNSEGDVI